MSGCATKDHRPDFGYKSGSTSIYSHFFPGSLPASVLYVASEKISDQARQKYKIGNIDVSITARGSQTNLLIFTTDPLTTDQKEAISAMLLPALAEAQEAEEKTTEVNQSLQTTIMAVTDAAAQPPRQP